MSRQRAALLAALAAVPILSYVAVAVVLHANDGKAGRASRASTSASAGATISSSPTSSTEASTTTSPTTSTTTGPATSTFPKRADEPVAASNPKDLAAQITAAEAAIHDAATSDEQLEHEAHVAQVAYRGLVNHPELQGPTFALLTGEVQATAQDNVSAGAKLRSMITQPKPTLPPWRIVAPAPAAELLGYYKEGETASGVAWQYLAAIHLVETRMGRIRGTSTAGAQGPMQFLPSTFKAYGNGGDINSNHDSILAAARLLAHNGAPADMRSALYNYNHDGRYADAVTLYVERMKADERAYFSYHEWQVYYVTTTGDVWLYEGYGT